MSTTRDELLRTIAARPSPTRPQVAARGRWLVVLSIGVALTVFALAGGLEHSAGRPLAYTALLSGGWMLFAAVLSMFVLRRRSTLGRQPRWLATVALAAPLVLLLWMQAFDGLYVEPFSRIGLRCMGYTLAMSVLPLATFMVLRRGVEPRGPAHLGAAVGALIGAWAGAIVQLWCPLVNLPHTLIGHVLPLSMLIATGALWGRRALDVSTTA